MHNGLVFLTKAYNQLFNLAQINEEEECGIDDVD